MIRRSASSAAYPIVAALLAADAFLGPGREWRPCAAEQERFLGAFFAAGRSEVGRIPEIESLASRDAAELNEFLARRGFPAFFAPFGGHRFGTASVLDLLAEWAREGHVTELETEDGRRFPAVRIAAGGVRFLRAPAHPRPIARLATRSGDIVFMTMMDEPLRGFDLLELALVLSRVGQEVDEFDGLVFPMVDLEQEIGLGWLAGLATDDDDGLPWEIEAALQRNRLRMNEIGARAESAVLLQVVPASIDFEREPDHVIDQPFLLWFEREGLTQPLLAAYVAEEHWRNPGDLGEAA